MPNVMADDMFAVEFRFPWN